MMNYRPTILFALLTILIFSCKKSNLEVHRNLDDNGKVVEEYTRDINTHVKQGLYSRFYENSEALAEQATFVNDTLDGLHVYYFETGDTQTVAKMSMGIFEGPFREYYPNGQVMQSYNHINGKIKGTFYEFYESGAKKGVLEFDDNNEHGPFVEYYENGNKSFEGTYYKGKEAGELLEYNEAGELVRKANCENGICSTTWKKED